MVDDLSGDELAVRHDDGDLIACDDPGGPQADRGHDPVGVTDLDEVARTHRLLEEND